MQMSFCCQYVNVNICQHMSIVFISLQHEMTNKYCVGRHPKEICWKKLFIHSAWSNMMRVTVSQCHALSHLELNTCVYTFTQVSSPLPTTYWTGLRLVQSQLQSGGVSAPPSGVGWSMLISATNTIIIALNSHLYISICWLWLVIFHHFNLNSW